MLRGVNKQIIEINDIGSEYFEKALLFVKADSKITNSKLEKEAQRIMSNYFDLTQNGGHIGFLRYTEQKKTKVRKAFMFFGGGVAVVMAIAAVLFIF